jgi:hypothetical protein
LPPENRQNVLKELSRVSKSFVLVAYYHKYSIQGLLRKKMRTKKEIPWHPVDIKQIHKELEAANLKMLASNFLLPGISETVVILARKL